MASLVQLFNEWEIQLLVLLSFMIQAFLFFAGGLRRRSHNGLFRLLVWISYLGADFVAVYALGLISRLDDDATAGRGDKLTGTHDLMFLWAPLLLLHLGGQDTITAFALEDNNLWLRHLLNLLVQVGVALYALWKSMSEINTQLLVQSILVFVAGTIKYGERTWALRFGVLKSVGLDEFPRYTEQLIAWATKHVEKAGGNQMLENMDGDDTSSHVNVLCVALHSMPNVMNLFRDTGLIPTDSDIWAHERFPLVSKLPKILDIQLGLVYEYTYTKAAVFQTRAGIILRCISQTSFLASFVLFFMSNKQRYSSVDTVVSYALFVGGFCLEVCSMVSTVKSPWTWAWLEARGGRCGSLLAPLFVRWQRNRVMWSGTSTMGQYSMHNYDDRQSTRSLLKQKMRKVVDAWLEKDRKFWVSKLLDTKFVDVDKTTMRCIFETIAECPGNHLPATMDIFRRTTLPQGCPFLRELLNSDLPGGNIEWKVIAALHTYTEAQLRLYSPGASDVDGESTRDMVQKISRYIVYLLALQPEMLPVVMKDIQLKLPRKDELHVSHGASSGISDYFHSASANTHTLDEEHYDFSSKARAMLTELEMPVPPENCTREQLLETKEAWMRLLIYIADNSRPELHAAQLARGGELLTLVWLFMAHRRNGYIVRDMPKFDFMGVHSDDEEV